MNNDPGKSLLNPGDTVERISHARGGPDGPPLNRYATEDLGLSRIAEKIARGRLRTESVLAILQEMPQDTATITYRQNVFRDILESEELKNDLNDLLPYLEELTDQGLFKREQESYFLQTLMRLGELELYADCIDSLAEILSRHERDIRSEGLLALKTWIESLRDDDEFRTLSRELPGLKEGLRMHRSLTIGVNLDDALRPVEAAILSVNAESYTARSFVSRLFHAHAGEFSVSTPIRSNPGGASAYQFPLAPLFQDLDLILKNQSRQITGAVEKFLRINTGRLSILGPELGFYLGAAQWAHELTDAGLPVCIPTPLEKEERILTADGFYSVLLADRLMEESGAGAGRDIVLNRIRFDDDGRIFILTGPNQGGKTTWTQGVGALQVLFQAGIFVPATGAALSPVDTIATHFPSEERGRLDTGRLSEEAERLQAIMASVSPLSLILMNESLSSTSPAEGMSIAEDILTSLRFLGTRAVFATHFHDLAFRCGIMNAGIEGNSVISSLTAGAGPREAGDAAVKRSYTILPGAPAGVSYARDIADRYGLCLERLTETFQSRKTKGSGNPV